MGIRLQTPKFRVSFPELFKATSFNDGVPKFRLTQLYPKSEPLTAIRDAIQKVIADKWGTKVPKNLKLPILDGDLKAETVGYAGCHYIRATAEQDQPPAVRTFGNSLVTDPREVYAGCYAVAMVTVYAYDRKDSKGVGVAFDAVRKVQDGEPFGAKPADPDVDFANVKDEDLY